MNITEHLLVHGASGLLIAGMLALCLRSRPQRGVVSGRQIYRVHPGWFVFAAVGGLFLVGIFAFATTTARPEDRMIATGFSIGSGVFFVVLAFVLRAASVTVDGDRLISRTLLGERVIDLRQIERVEVIGLSVEVRFREDVATRKRARRLTFLAGLRGLGELVGTLRARATVRPA